MSAHLKGYEQVEERVRALADKQRMDRLVNAAFRATVKRIRKQAISEAKTRGVLKAVAQRDPSWVNGIIKFVPMKTAGTNLFAARLQLTGLGTIQETGGRFRAHVIKAKTANRLGFELAGRWRAFREVKHPGATHPAMPFFEPAVIKAAPGMIADFQRELAEHLAAAAKS